MQWTQCEAAMDFHQESSFFVANKIIMPIKNKTTAGKF
jgi:hypothetical protein